MRHIEYNSQASHGEFAGWAEPSAQPLTQPDGWETLSFVEPISSVLLDLTRPRIGRRCPSPEGGCVCQDARVLANAATTTIVSGVAACSNNDTARTEWSRRLSIGGFPRSANVATGATRQTRRRRPGPRGGSRCSCRTGPPRRHRPRGPSRSLPTPPTAGRRTDTPQRSEPG